MNSLLLRFARPMAHAAATTDPPLAPREVEEVERLHLKRRRVGRLADDAVEQVRVPVVELAPDAALGGVKRIRRHVEPLVNRVYYLATRVPLATLIIIIITRLRRFRRVGEVRAEALATLCANGREGPRAPASSARTAATTESKK